jgi:hypothetical protein
MTKRRACSSYTLTISLLALLLLNGCTSIQYAPHHAQQQRVQRVLSQLLPHTERPRQQYTLKMYHHKPGARDANVVMRVWGRHHMLFSVSMAEAMDDRLLSCLLAYGVAHFEQHFYAKRMTLGGIGMVLSAVANAAAPGAGLAVAALTLPAQAALAKSEAFAADEQAVQYIRTLGYTSEDYIGMLHYLQQYNYVVRVFNTSGDTTAYSQRMHALRTDARIIPPTGDSVEYSTAMPTHTELREYDALVEPRE